MADREGSARDPVHRHLWLKAILSFLSLFYWTLGGVSIIVGHLMFVIKEPVLRQYVYLVFNPTAFFIAIGCAIFLVSTCGFVGAARENRRLLGIYWLALSGLLLVALAAPVLLLFQPSFSAKVRRSTDDALRRAILHYRDDRNLKYLIDTFQSTLQCCGMSHKGYLDWRANPSFKCAHKKNRRKRCGVPYSCCKKTGRLRNTWCGFNTTEEVKRYIPPKERIFTEGCKQTLERLVKSNMVLMMGLSMLIVVSLAIGAAGAWMLRNSIKYMTRPQYRGIRSLERYAESRV